MSNTSLEKLAIFYGWPSAVNGAGGNIDLAVDTFKEYDLVVFGQGLECPSHGDHVNTKAIINHSLMVNTKVFGYIDAVIPLDEIQTKIDLWVNMGVKGIFMDQFGYDFGVLREKQRAIIWSIHHGDCNKKLHAFVNAWKPEDVFDSTVDDIHNPNGKPTLLGPDDLYLAESFAIMNGAYDDNDLDANGVKDWQDKANKLVNYRNTYGTKLASVSTTIAEIEFDQNKANYAYLSSAINNFDAWGWSEPYFSAGDSLLPFRVRTDILGTSFTSGVLQQNGVLQRQTNVGIKIDTNNHTIGFTLDL